MSIHFYRVHASEDGYMAPSVGEAVKRQLEVSIGHAMKMNGFKSRVFAAMFLLRGKPDWYWQTPEGEYLEWVIRGEK